MGKYIFLVSMVFVQQAGATGFHCYTAPGAPVQTLEYSSGICLDGEKAGGANADVEADGERPVICMITAGCKAVSDAEALKPPPELDQATLFAQYGDQTIKSAQLICKGTAVFKNRIAVSANCPPLDQCQKDISFHYFSPRANVNFVERTSVPNPEATKAGEAEGRR